MRETTIKSGEGIFIGSNIRKAREARHMKSRDLVIKVQLLGADINVFSLSKIEANTQHVKASQLKAIAKALQVDCMELLKAEGEE